MTCETQTDCQDKATEDENGGRSREQSVLECCNASIQVGKEVHSTGTQCGTCDTTHSSVQTDSEEVENGGSRCNADAIQYAREMSEKTTDYKYSRLRSNTCTQTDSNNDEYRNSSVRSQ